MLGWCAGMRFSHLGWILPLGAQRADHHEHPQQLRAHLAATRGLEEVHQAEAALTDRRVNGIAVDNGDQEEHAVVVARVVLVGELVEHAPATASRTAWSAGCRLEQSPA